MLQVQEIACQKHQQATMKSFADDLFVAASKSNLIKNKKGYLFAKDVDHDRRLTQLNCFGDSEFALNSPFLRVYAKKSRLHA
jgi:hypothetical protein